MDMNQLITTRSMYKVKSPTGWKGFGVLDLAKYRGVRLYLKEMEWRYNNRDRDLFDLLVQYMLGAVGS